MYINRKFPSKWLSLKHSILLLNLSPPIYLNPAWLSSNVANTIAKYGISMCLCVRNVSYKGECSLAESGRWNGFRWDVIGRVWLFIFILSTARYRHWCRLFNSQLWSEKQRLGTFTSMKMWFGEPVSQIWFNMRVARKTLIL